MPNDKNKFNTSKVLWILILALVLLAVGMSGGYVCLYLYICSVVDWGSFLGGVLAYVGNCAVAVISFWQAARSMDASDKLLRMEKAKARVLLKLDSSGENRFLKKRSNEHHITLCFKNQGGGVAKTAKVVRFGYFCIKPQNETKKTETYKEEREAHFAKAPDLLLAGEELEQAHEAWKPECETWDKRERELLNEIEFFSATAESYKENVNSYILPEGAILLSFMTKKDWDSLTLSDEEKETLIQLGKKQPNASPMLFKIEFELENENSLVGAETETCSFFAVASPDGKIQECETGKTVYTLKPN